MSRKPKKGYFVRGEFVAEGSSRDLELKAELQGGDAPSRTALKRQADALQDLGVALIDLRADLRAALNLPDALTQALDEARRITDHGARRRHLQYLGKLMRRLPPDVAEAASAALEAQNRGDAVQTQMLHQAEAWRARLLADDNALAEWLRQHPDSDAQQLRALLRQARKDAVPEPPGAAPRHGRAYREVFQFIRDALAGTVLVATEVAAFNPGHDV